MKPIVIGSLSEYEIFFGGAPLPIFTVEEGNSDNTNDLTVSMNGKNLVLKQNELSSFYLYNSLKLFIIRRRKI
jgi:hypothetical protein